MTRATGGGTRATCGVCGAPLSQRWQMFGAVDDPVCLACYVRYQEPPDDNLTDCPVCGLHSAYHKIDAGYPGLYHCTECGAWIDNQTEQTYISVSEIPIRKMLDLRCVRCGGPVGNRDYEADVCICQACTDKSIDGTTK